MYEIVVGRDEEDRKAFGNKGTFMIGKHYVKMGQTTSLSSAIYMDVLRSHVVSVFGKRGSGKSYTISAIAEGMMGLETEFTRNLSVVMFDTMGIFWTMKYENKKDERLLREWGIQYQRFNIRIYAPFGSFAEYKSRGIPVDLPFSISPSELSASDWCSIFGIEPTSELGALIGRVVPNMRKQLKSFSVKDIIDAVRKDERTRDEIKAAVENMFYSTEEWGLFGEESTPVSDLAVGGQITVIDLSPYAVAGGKSNIRALVIGLVSKKLFNERMLVRKAEEMESLKRATSFTRASAETKKDVPLIWLVVDECLPYGSRVRTEKGTMPIGELVELYETGQKVKVMGYDQTTGKHGYYDVTNTFKINPRSLLKIVTETGRELKCTSNHFLLSDKGFVPAAIAANIATPLSGGCVTSKKAVVARLAGHVLGDGWISQKTESVGFSGKGNTGDLEKIKSDLSQLGFNSSAIYSRNTFSEITTEAGLKLQVIGHSQEVRGRRPAFRYFSSLQLPVGDKALSDFCIPDWLMLASEEEKTEFLAALMGSDGTAPSPIVKVKGDFNPIRLSFNKSTELEEAGFRYALQIKKLFEDLGVEVSSITKRSGNLRKSGIKTFKIVLTLGKSLDNTIRFLEKVGYRYCEEKEIRANKWLCYLKARQFEIVRREKLREQAIALHSKGLGKIKISKILGVPDYVIREWIYYKGTKAGSAKSFFSFDEWVNNRIGNGVLYEKIVSAEQIEAEPMFDITVEEVHNFVADDFVVHNCHEFLPRHGTTPASNALITVLREGRQPGISLVLASQQPGQIHTDVMTQSDTVISHRVTAKIDVDALGTLMQSYMREGLDKSLDDLPRVKGAALLFDDTNERLYPMRVRPKATWHGGSSPSLIAEVKSILEF